MPEATHDTLNINLPDLIKLNLLIIIVATIGIMHKINIMINVYSIIFEAVSEFSFT